MKSSFREIALAALCLLLLPAAASADGVVVDSCGNSNMVGNPPANIMKTCVLAGGGTAQYTAQARSGLNTFHDIGSPITVTGVAGQVNMFNLVIASFPHWDSRGPVLTVLTLAGTATINQPGASINVVLTGMLGGPALVITQNFTANSVFSISVSGFQAIADAAVMRLEVTITGNATLNLPNSAEFQGEIPEPATLFLFGTGLAGVAMKMRKKLRKQKKT